jgi:hypothetical protein
MSEHVLVPSPRGFRGAPSERITIRQQEGYIKAKFFMLTLGGCMWNIQCNVEFEYQLSIYSRTKDNHGKPWSS